MQEQHFNELKEDMSNVLSDLVPIKNLSVVKQRVQQKINELNEQNKLLSLPVVEYNLLVDYRSWKIHNGLGMFHWKVRK